MIFEIDEGGGAVAFVRVGGRLDTLTAPEFTEQALALVDGGRTRVVFDLSAVEYVSSAGLKAFLATAKHAGAQGGAVALCSLQEPVERIFLIAGFDAFLRLCPDRDAALEVCRPACD